MKNGFRSDWPHGAVLLPPDLVVRIDRFLGETPPTEGEYFVLLGTLLRRGVRMELVLPVMERRMNDPQSVRNLLTVITQVRSRSMRATNQILDADVSKHDAAAILLVTARDDLESLFVLTRLHGLTYPEQFVSEDLCEATHIMTTAVAEVDAFVSRNGVDIMLACLKDALTSERLPTAFMEMGRYTEDEWWHNVVWNERFRGRLREAAHLLQQTG